MFDKSALRFSHRGGVCAFALLSTTFCGFMPQAHAAGVVVISSNISNDADTNLASAPTDAVQKVITGKYAVQVDNSWVIYQNFGSQNSALPIMKFYNAGLNGSYSLGGSAKLKSAGSGQAGTGAIFNVGGLVFAPCAVAPKTKCAVTNGISGVGLGFGQVTFGAGQAAGGWASDSGAFAHLTNKDSNSGSIAGVATDTTNGAYAVGWNLNTTSLTNHAVVLTLNSTGQTYAPTVQTDLGTLGGPTSEALAISRNAKYVVGGADTASNKAHAVYAMTGASAWTDIATGFPAEVLKSHAVAVSNTGIVAGTASVRRLVAGKLKTLDIGFVYDTNTSTVKFFEAPGANVIPLKVLDSGQVIGNLEFLGSGSGTPADHPFLFNGTDVVDFGTMILASTSQAAFGCRINRPNNLGEVAGSCIPNNTTGYGVSGTAFYLNTQNVTPTFIDVNAAIHATSDASTPGVKHFAMGTVSSIDDEHEITVIGLMTSGSKAKVAAFLASQAGYNQ